MFVLKIDFPTGVAYFTGRKKIVQGSESPGLTGELSEAKHFEDEEEAKRYCKMLVKKYDMDFYYSAEEKPEVIPEIDPMDLWVSGDAEVSAESGSDASADSEPVERIIFPDENDDQK